MPSVGPIVYDSGKTLKGLLLSGEYAWSVTASAWVAIGEMTFADCLAALREPEPGAYFLDLPAALGPGLSLSLLVYLDGATSISDEKRILEPLTVTTSGSAASTSTYGGDLAGDVAARCAKRCNDASYSAASAAQYLQWLCDAQQLCCALKPSLLLSEEGLWLDGAPIALTANSTLLVPSHRTAALIELVAESFHRSLDPDKSNLAAADEAHAKGLRFLGVA